MTQFNAPAYDIERPTGQCAFTGRVLAPGEAYMATLVELDEQEAAQLGKNKSTAAAAALGLKRLDVAMEAWQQGKRPERIFGYWKTVVPEPHKKKKVFVDDDILLSLLRRLADESDPQKLAFRFVLALILMRRKMLRYDGMVTKADQAWWQLVPKLDPAKGPLGKWNEQEKIEVLDPHLDEQQTQQVTEQLGQVLEAEL